MRGRREQENTDGIETTGKISADKVLTGLKLIWTIGGLRLEKKKMGNRT